MKLQLTLILMVFAAIGAFAQTKVVTGKVVSGSDKQGLPGVNVVVDGNPSKGTITDVDGNYRIELAESENTLIFSSLGFNTVTQVVGTQTEINVELGEDTKTLDEVVVVGYGVQRKSDLTGAVSSIKGADLVKVPSFNAVQSLQGKAAGVQVYNSSGAPGASPIVRIRGVGTFNNSSPIYVVDGVILNDINFLNSADIASMEVLKDASSTAIYGSRGANGVIIVTTKQGKAGGSEPVISFNADYSQQTVAKKIDLLNGREFGTIANEIIAGTFNNLDLVANTDWQSLIFRSAPQQTYQVSATGSTAKSQYYFGVGYYNQQGIIPKSSFERLTVKMNNTYTISDHFKLGNNLTITPARQQTAPNVVYQAYRAQPTSPAYYADGTFGAVRNVGNPLADLAYSNNFNKGLRMVGNVFAEVIIHKDFLVRSSFGVDLANNTSSNFTPAFTVFNPDGTANQQQNLYSQLSKGSNNSTSWLWENTVNFNKVIKDHRIDLLGGYTMQQFRNEFINIQGSNIIRNDEDVRYLNNPSYFYNAGANPAINNLSNISNGVDPGNYYGLVSFLARANYTYKERYLLTASYRRDGSSKFQKSNRWGNFPSVAVGWNVINEDFMQNINFLSNLKVRASTGAIGNEKINYLAQYSTVASNGTTSPVFGTGDILTPGATFGVSGNPNLKWETTLQTDAGLEVGFFDNRLTGEFDYYNRKTKDILVALTPPGYFGNGDGARIVYNAGTVRNTGFEFNVAWQDSYKDFTYRIGVLGNTIKNKVLVVGGSQGIDSTIVDGFLSGSPSTLTRVGLPIGSFFGYRTNGIFQNADELAAYPHDAQAGVGDLRFVDVNGDGKINSFDRTNLGSPVPTFVFGYNFMVGWKGIELQADFQGQLGNKILNGKEIVRPDPYNFEKHVINRWTGEGTSNTEPRPSYGGYNYNISDHFIQDGSYMRLRTLTLAYSLPRILLTRISLKSVRIYVRGTNLFTVSKFTGYSPDFGSDSVTANNIDLGVYPLAKIYSAGLNLTF